MRSGKLRARSICIRSLWAVLRWVVVMRASLSHLSCRMIRKVHRSTSSICWSPASPLPWSPTYLCLVSAKSVHKSPSLRHSARPRRSSSRFKICKICWRWSYFRTWVPRRFKKTWIATSMEIPSYVSDVVFKSVILYTKPSWESSPESISIAWKVSMNSSTEPATL